LKRPRQLTRALCFVGLINHSAMTDVKGGSSDSHNCGSYRVFVRLRFSNGKPVQSLMNKLLLLLLVIALVACVACQRQKAQEQQEMTQPDSSASPSTSPKKPYVFKSQAQKFQPRQIVPMTSPIRETPTSTPTASEPPNEN
jgi:hypothetical protein